MRATFPVYATSAPTLLALMAHDPVISRWCLAVDEWRFFLRKRCEKAFRIALKKLGDVILELLKSE